MKNFIPLFVLIGLVLVAARNLHNRIPCGDANPRHQSVGGASELLAWSMARSYHLPIIHSQLV